MRKKDVHEYTKNKKLKVNEYIQHESLNVIHISCGLFICVLISNIVIQNTTIMNMYILNKDNETENNSFSFILTERNETFPAAIEHLIDFSFYK